ncbi:MAG: hypothetical protein A2214_00135 [Candidatus Harrisonbacteria bacterium RIFOXYA1_FULL_48_8]|uniref:VanZ-like domain-containing protein n=3 Tax=Parcubacteria group TaxID=1794811 RepID=A0A1G1ZXA7_9BACT|nr:MAG: hypothetical protein A3E64_00805 [Candidatus Harrisonbacteria bacterium RIFCSPHIGHO2_12_FULL_48_16]OGY69214.1 MAG: hypothetical protein A2214_00135 [Candidatus Harrisonbacteria bacterium RIFOXYA1_FULL_48_8]
MGKAIIYGFFLIHGLNVLAMFFGLYVTFPWYDTVLHIGGGAWVALLCVWLYKNEKNPILILGFVALIGVLWEFSEYLFLNDVMAWMFNEKSMPQTISDTLTDLFADLIGGSVFLLLSRIKSQNK